MVFYPKNKFYTGVTYFSQQYQKEVHVFYLKEEEYLPYYRVNRYFLICSDKEGNLEIDDISASYTAMKNEIGEWGKNQLDICLADN